MSIRKWEEMSDAERKNLVWDFLNNGDDSFEWMVSIREELIEKGEYKITTDDVKEWWESMDEEDQESYLETHE